MELMFQQGIYVNKTSASKECFICHYWYFLSKVFRFQQSVGNACHDISMRCFVTNNISILNIHGVDYCFIIFGINKGKAIEMIVNSVLDDKGSL